jgi:peptidoglycan/LPS O-acetylase OafA/YrhL
VAILLVLGAHPVVPAADSGRLRLLTRAGERFGWTGVDLFFVLSGFLVGGLLLQELHARGSLDIRRFVIRRGLKIWPAYLIYLAYVFVLVAAGEGALQAGQHMAGLSAALHKLLPNLLHVQNYAGTVRDHTWSLAVEEHFYLLLPVLLFCATRRRSGAEIARIPAVPIVSLGLILLCTLSRALARSAPSADVGAIVWATHNRVDGLFLGVLLAYLHIFHRARLAAIGRHRTTLLILGLALLSPLAFTDPATAAWFTSLGVVTLYLGYACLLLALVFITPGAGLLGRLCSAPPGRALAFVGYYSYSVYLWHMDAGHFRVQGFLKRGFLGGADPALRGLVAGALYVLLALGVGVLLARLIEMPTLALRDRLFPSRARAVEPTGPAARAPADQ